MANPPKKPPPPPPFFPGNGRRAVEADIGQATPRPARRREVQLPPPSAPRGPASNPRTPPVARPTPPEPRPAPPVARPAPPMPRAAPPAEPASPPPAAPPPAAPPPAPSLPPRRAGPARGEAPEPTVPVPSLPVDRLLRDVASEPPGTHPQRGAIGPLRARLMAFQIDVADRVRAEIAPDLPLDWPLDRTRALYDQARQRIDHHLAATPPPSGARRDEVVEAILHEVFGLGPLEPLLACDDFSEVMVNGPFVVFVEHKGRLVESGHQFLDDDHVERMVKRIVQPLGRPVGEDTPLVDARLPDGSRVNAVIRPCAIDGPNLTIRKFKKDKLTIDDLVGFGSMTPEMSEFLRAVVVARQNVVVSGGTGSGKTTLINCLSHFIPDHERVVTIEDAAELQLKQRHVVRLETKKPSMTSTTEVTIRDCVVNALRMRPERIIVGECRSGEALDMLQAMNTGHDGSMTTVHSNDPRSAISRLETLCLMSGVDLPVLIVRKQIADAVDVIVQASRLRDGSRRVTAIAEIVRLERDMPILNTVFEFKQTGERDGKILGHHTATGNRPECEPALRSIGFDPPASFYRPSRG